MDYVEILGIKINNITFDQALHLINNFVVIDKPKQITTVNPEFIMAAQDDHEFANILNNSDLAVPDGSGLLFTSRYFLNKPLKEKIHGIDLMMKMIELAEKKKYPIFLLGGQNGVANKTAEVLKEQFPKLIICGTYEGYPELTKKTTKSFLDLRMTDLKSKLKDPNLEILEAVRKAKPKILFVAYGAPKQDKFIARYKKILNVPVMMGVGGSFDFISGRAKRAPKWMQKLWLEWLWRLFTEPWRFNRIFTATIKFPLVVLYDKLFKK